MRFGKKVSLQAENGNMHELTSIRTALIDVTPIWDGNILHRRVVSSEKPMSLIKDR